MPAYSKAQRRLFALALQFKRGEIPVSKVSDEVKDLSKLPEETKEKIINNYYLESNNKNLA